MESLINAVIAVAVGVLASVPVVAILAVALLRRRERPGHWPNIEYPTTAQPNVFVDVDSAGNDVIEAQWRQLS